MTEPSWQIGFGSKDTWWAYCGIRAPDADTALTRARREVRAIWQVINLHRGDDAPPVPEEALSPLEGFPNQEEGMPDGAGLFQPALEAAGYETTLEARDHPWEAGHARETVKAILRTATAMAGMTEASAEAIIRHSGATTDSNRRPMLNVRCDVEIRSSDGCLDPVPLPHAMRAALGACAAAMLVTNPEMNTREIGVWPEDGIAIPRSASARAALREEIAASAASDAVLVAGLLRQLGLDAEADALLQRLERLP